MVGGHPASAVNRRHAFGPAEPDVLTGSV
jgi:hypothetical protein